MTALTWTCAVVWAVVALGYAHHALDRITQRITNRKRVPMSSPQLRNAVRAAGPDATARTAALLHVAGEAAHAAEDPASLLYAGLCTSLMRDSAEGVDPVLVGAVVAASDHAPGTLAAVVRDLHDTDPDGLPGALCREVALAAFEAGDATAAFRAALDDQDGGTS